MEGLATGTGWSGEKKKQYRLRLLDDSPNLVTFSLHGDSFAALEPGEMSMLRDVIRKAKREISIRIVDNVSIGIDENEHIAIKAEGDFNIDHKARENIIMVFNDALEKAHEELEAK